jgi:phage terminase small subunit
MMGQLSNPRHERFAQGLAHGKSADEAYRAAGFSENRGNASRLKSNESIQSRVAELQQRVVENVSLTKEWVIEQLIDNVKRAKELEDLSPANTALQLLGKELGMFVERTENINVNHDVTDEPLSDEQWERDHAAATVQ